MKTYPFLAVFICLCVNTAAQEYSFKYGNWNFFPRNYFRFCFRICQKFFFRLYILLKSIFYLFIE